MTAFTVEGVVENGRIRLDNDVQLPEHVRVYVVVPDFETTPKAHVYSPHLLRGTQAADFAKQILPAPANAEL